MQLHVMKLTSPQQKCVIEVMIPSHVHKSNANRNFAVSHACKRGSAFLQVALPCL